MTLDAWLNKSRMAEAEFAERLGCTQASVNRWRRSLRTPSATSQERIRAATGGKVTPADWHRAALEREADAA